MKKKGKKNELDKRLREWKKKGYNTKVLERKYKVPNANEFKKQLKEWKKKGYDTSVLERKVK